VTGQPGRRAVVRVHLVAGAPRRRWCHGCHTSAGVDVTVYALTDTAGPFPVGEVSVCARCGDVDQAAAQAAQAVAEALGGDPGP
jgi:hypothetical protein